MSAEESVVIDQFRSKFRIVRLTFFVERHGRTLVQIETGNGFEKQDMGFGETIAEAVESWHKLRDAG